MRRQIINRGNNAIFDFIASRLEMDRILEDALSIFIVIVIILSMVAGIAVWPVVWDLKAVDSTLSAVCANIHTAGLIISLICLIVTVALMLWQRSDYKPFRVFFLNLGIFWFSSCVVLITQQNVLTALTQNAFMGTLLWLILSVFMGYILSVIPSVLITAVSTVAHKILDMILPN